MESSVSVLWVVYGWWWASKSKKETRRLAWRRAALKRELLSELSGRSLAIQCNRGRLLSQGTEARPVMTVTGQTSDVSRVTQEPLALPPTNTVSGNARALPSASQASASSPASSPASPPPSRTRSPRWSWLVARSHHALPFAPAVGGFQREPEPWAPHFSSPCLSAKLSLINHSTRVFVCFDETYLAWNRISIAITAAPAFSAFSAFSIPPPFLRLGPKIQSPLQARNNTHHGPPAAPPLPLPLLLRASPGTRSFRTAAVAAAAQQSALSRFVSHTSSVVARFH